MLVYAAIGAVGFLLLLFMLIFGDMGGDHELPAGDIDGGHFDFGHEGGPSVFSLRIMSAFLTAFGVGGVVARFLDLSHIAASGIGVASGVVLSGLVYQFARILYSQQASSEVQMATLVGASAQVAIGIPRAGVGQVTLVAGGERTMQIARSRDGEPIPAGADVIITAVSGEAVIVDRPPGAAPPSPAPVPPGDPS
jgi:membrane protein implicated in regulation of membrane protease activity